MSHAAFRLSDDSSVARLAHAEVQVSAESQMLLWLEWEPNKELPSGGRFKVADVAVKPKHVWTLLRETDRKKAPALPIRPQHHVNAFLEDEIHDWQWRGGKLRYFSRIADRSIWLLLEYGA